MSSADPRPRAAAERRPPRGRGERGFTLIEVMLAFAILAVAMSLVTLVQEQAFQNGVQALNLRDLRVMADTVFRRIVYEHWRWNDGDTGTGDVWYAEFAGLRSAERDRWKIYRMVLHKRRGLVAGTDPTGRTEALFDTTGTGTNRTTTTTGSTSSGSSSTGGTTDAETGEPAYLLTLDVFLQDAETPELSLHSVVPVPDSEREEEK